MDVAAYYGTSAGENLQQIVTCILYNVLSEDADCVNVCVRYKIPGGENQSNEILFTGYLQIMNLF